MQAGGGSAGRLQSGDPLRAIAALAVLVFHVAVVAGIASGEPAEAFGPLRRVFASGDLGLYLFFALSGYLLGRPFVAWLLTDGRRPDSRRYARHRLARIVPAFWLFAALSILFFGDRGASAGEVASLFGFVHTWDPEPVGNVMRQAWTLNAEAFFYLLLPVASLLAAAVLPRRGRAMWLLGGVATVSLVSLGIRDAAGDVVQAQWPISVLYAFAPGLVLAIVEARGWRPPPWLPHALLGVAAAGLTLYILGPRGLDLTRFVSGTIAPGALLGAVVARQWLGARPWRVLDSRALHWMGERSYGIYLAHTLAIGVIDEVMFDVGEAWGALAIGLAVTVPLTLLAAHLSWTFLERPILRRADRRRATPPERTVTAQTAP